MLLYQMLGYYIYCLIRQTWVMADGGDFACKIVPEELQTDSFYYRSTCTSYFPIQWYHSGLIEHNYGLATIHALKMTDT